MTPRKPGDKPDIEAAIDALKPHEDRLGALASIAARIGIYRDTRRLAREAMQAIADLMPINEALLLLIDKDTNSLVFHEGFSLLETDMDRYRQDVNWDNGMAGEAVRRREPILIKDLSAWSQSRDYPEENMKFGNIPDFTPYSYPEESVSLGWIPLMTPEHVIGVLSVTTTAPHRLDQSDMEFLLILGSQLGIYLENAHLLEELEERNSQLLRRNQDLEELLSVISHDLRSPLATIGGYASLLIKKGEGLDPSERTQFAETIFRKTKETSQRFDDLLSIFRADDGREGEVPTEVDVRTVIQEALEEAGTGENSERFDIEIPARLPRLMGYSTHLVNVFANLFSNAFKFTGSQENPHITVAYQKMVSGDRMIHQFSISDNGIGIPAEYIKDVFRPFTRVPTLEDIPGNGIGLASVHRIIRSHKGTVDIQSTEGEGTSVTFTLPWEEIE